MPVQLNQMYGRLYTVSRLPRLPMSRQKWLCNCLCGAVLLVIRADQLITGRTSSCGCSRRTSMGMSGTPTYKTWAAMRRRCNDLLHPRYEDYGGRGIKVCDRWNDSRTGFAAFVEDMGLRPERMTLDRVRVNEGYSKDNCKWSTLIEQRWNRRDMIRLRGDDGDAAEYEHWNEVEREQAAG